MIKKATPIPNLKDCPAKITVDFGKYFDGAKPRELECCLFSPHLEYKHYAPSLLITCGGETHKVSGWSHRIERIYEKEST